VFDSTGLAIQDVAAARVVYERASADGAGYGFDMVGFEDRRKSLHGPLSADRIAGRRSDTPVRTDLLDEASIRRTDTVLGRRE